MMSGKIIETRVTGSPKQEAEVQAAAKCPECGDALSTALNAVKVSQTLQRNVPLGNPPQTEYFAVCECGCTWVITWEETACPK